MSIPDEFILIVSQFQRALRTGDFSTIDAIPLDKLLLAKAHLVCDRNTDYYQLILDKIREKEREQKLLTRIQGMTFNISQSAIDILHASEINEVESIATNGSLLNQKNHDDVGIAIVNLTKIVAESRELSETQRREALELLKTLSGQAPIPKEERLPPASIKAVFNSLASIRVHSD